MKRVFFGTLLLISAFSYAGEAKHSLKMSEIIRDDGIFIREFEIETEFRDKKFESMSTSIVFQSGKIVKNGLNRYREDSLDHQTPYCKLHVVIPDTMIKFTDGKFTAGLLKLGGKYYKVDDDAMVAEHDVHIYANVLGNQDRGENYLSSYYRWYKSNKVATGTVICSNPKGAPGDLTIEDVKAITGGVIQYIPSDKAN